MSHHLPCTECGGDHPTKGCKSGVSGAENEQQRLAKLSPQRLVAEYEHLAANWGPGEWEQLQLMRREVVRRMQVPAPGRLADSNPTVTSVEASPIASGAQSEPTPASGVPQPSRSDLKEGS